MARIETLAFTRSAPYLLERALEQTVTCPVRYGSGGNLQEPTSGTITIRKPRGTDLVTDAAVVVASSMAQYTFTPDETDTIGAGWELIWTIVVDGSTYTYRQTGYMCEYVFRNVISENALYTRVPELRFRVPQHQRTETGDGTGWQPQIDEAYYELVQRLLDDGRQPWLIEEATGYREWLLTRALQLCIGTVATSAGSSWEAHRKTAYFEHRNAAGKMRFRYSDNSVDEREAGTPIIRLCSVTRPLR